MCSFTVLGGGGGHAVWNWNTLSYTPIQSIPNMLNGEYAGHSRTGMLLASRNCVQILATWGRALSCCNMR